MIPQENTHSLEESAKVEEFQGLYGPYHVSERLIQRIWLDGELDLSRLRTLSGKPIRVIRAGEWNLLGGPDFIGADLEIDGRRVTGDVEIHFRESDWIAHGHQEDEAYDRVVLHLVLFPPPAGKRRPAVTGDGRAIETAVLVDLLWHDLEEYAVNDAAARVSGRSDERVLEVLLALDPDERKERLRAAARARWDLKRHFAAIRVKRLGWIAACHATAMEVLGYSRNRAAMLAVADRFPVEAWRGGGVDPGWVRDQAGIRFQTQGVRPANQPRVRLAQYAALASQGGAWIGRLDAWAQDLPRGDGSKANGSVLELRRSLGLNRWRGRLKEGVMAGAIPGPRADSLAVDAFLPLLETQEGRDLFAYWFAWPTGDMPGRYRRILRQAGVAGQDRSNPFTQGWFQGVIGLILEPPIDT